MPVGYPSLYQLPINENFLVESDAYQFVNLTFPSTMTASINCPSMKIKPRKEHTSSFFERLFVKGLDFPIFDSLTDLSRIGGLVSFFSPKPLSERGISQAIATS
jgi:hypothetical protein